MEPCPWCWWNKGTFDCVNLAALPSTAVALVLVGSALVTQPATGAQASQFLVWPVVSIVISGASVCVAAMNSLHCPHWFVFGFCRSHYLCPCWASKQCTVLGSACRNWVNGALCWCSSVVQPEAMACVGTPWSVPCTGRVMAARGCSYWGVCDQPALATGRLGVQAVGWSWELLC